MGGRYGDGQAVRQTLFNFRQVVKVRDQTVFGENRRLKSRRIHPEMILWWEEEIDGREGVREKMRSCPSLQAMREACPNKVGPYDSPE